MKDMEKGLLEVEAKKATSDPDVIQFIGSTDSIDRGGDIVKQNWDLKAFRKNPVFLWGHKYGELPVGKAIKVWTEKTEAGARRLMFKIKFVPEDVYPFAGTVKQMYEQGFLSAVSVGFRPLETESESTSREAAGMDPISGDLFKKSELLELSGVTVPMNADALTSAVQRGVLDASTAKSFSGEMADDSVLDGADVDGIHRALDAIKDVEDSEEPKLVSFEIDSVEVTDAPPAWTTGPVIEDRLATSSAHNHVHQYEEGDTWTSVNNGHRHRVKGDDAGYTTTNDGHRHRTIAKREDKAVACGCSEVAEKINSIADRLDRIATAFEIRSLGGGEGGDAESVPEQEEIETTEVVEVEEEASTGVDAEMDLVEMLADVGGVLAELEKESNDE